MLSQVNYSNTIRFNRYIPVALLYMFFNSVLLPDGLLYTSLLIPVFLADNLIKGYIRHIFFFVLVSAAYAVVHLTQGIHPGFYLRSWLMAFCTFNFCLVAYRFIRSTQSQDHIVKVLTMFNGLLAGMALLFLFYRQGHNVFWYWTPFTPGAEPFPRLKLFMSEASVYSLIITPLFIYYMMAAFKTGWHRVFMALFILGGSLLLSFSLGVMSAMAASICMVLILHRHSLIRRGEGMKIIGWGALALLTVLVYLYFNPDHPLRLRIDNIFSGDDTSARGRTYEAFILASRILNEKYQAFGIGWGQIKTAARQVILSYYQYTRIPEAIRIPNAAAETLIYFGYVGFAIRLLAEGILFFKCKVASNSFRLAIFLFVFMYQFTGSYITQPAEYVLWILAFVNCFPQFDVIKKGNGL